MAAACAHLARGTTVAASSLCRCLRSRAKIRNLSDGFFSIPTLIPGEEGRSWDLNSPFFVVGRVGLEQKLGCEARRERRGEMANWRDILGFATTDPFSQGAGRRGASR